MRVRLFREGVVTPSPHRMIRPNGVDWDEPVPLTEENSSGKILGYVTRIRREPDGWVTGEVSIPLPRKHGIMAAIRGPVGSQGDNLDIYGTLVGCSPTKNPAFPGMVRR